MIAGGIFSMSCSVTPQLVTFRKEKRKKQAWLQAAPGFEALRVEACASSPANQSSVALVSHKSATEEKPEY